MRDMKDFKYKTSFSSLVKPLVSEEKDKYLALAAIDRIGEFVPDIDEKNIDLLPVAFNAYVVNRANKNGDVIDAETALSISRSFINKPINIEHNRDKVIGVVLTAGYSEFGTDRPLSEEEVKDMESPFNVTLGAVLWRVVNSGLADLVENASDPTSEDYLKISASWELGFSQYQLVITSGDKNIQNAERVTEEEKITELEENLKSFGGTGVLEDGRHIFRQVLGDVLPLGIGLTETPAADVKGILVKKDKNNFEGKSASKSSPDEESGEKNKSSQNIGENVKKVYNDSERKLMKINSINDITDESLKVLSASAISDYIREELKNASEKFVSQKTAVEDQLGETQEKHDALSKDHGEMKQELEKVQADLETLHKEKVAREKEEAFNQRMSHMDEEYALSDEDRKVIASDIEEMDDESFKTYSGKMQVLLKDKNKSAVAEKAALAAEAKASEETKVSEVVEPEASETTEEVVEEILEAEETENVEVPASTVTAEHTVQDRYANAFGLDQFDF